MSTFSNKERVIAQILSSMPTVKNAVKKLYIYFNAVLHKKNYTYKILDNRITNIESPFKDFESFGGYYDRPTIKNNKVVSNISECNTKHIPNKDRQVKVIVKDLKTNFEQFIGNTYSYTWQQGCREQWLDEDKIIYNAFENNSYFAKVFSLKENKVVKVFLLPNQDSYKDIYFLSINYRRIMNLRPDYGYRNLPLLSDKEMKDIANDGIFKVDYQTGKYFLLHSLQDIVNCEYKNIFSHCYHVANHLMINKNGQGFIFIHRFYESKRRYDRLMYSDFKNLKVLVDEGMISHCHWIDNENIIGYLRYNGKDGFYQINVLSGKIFAIEKLNKLNYGDGHPSYFGDWVTFDTYPDKSRMQHLFLYNIKTKRLTELLELHHSISYMNQTRCDLHPRFSDDGKYISFDSVYLGKRTQCYIDVSKITSDVAQ